MSNHEKPESLQARMARKMIEKEMANQFAIIAPPGSPIGGDYPLPSFSAIDVGQFPGFHRPWNNITPFTYRDGLTYLEVLERLRYWIRYVLVPHIDKEMREILEAWEESFTMLIDLVSEILIEYYNEWIEFRDEMYQWREELELEWNEFQDEIHNWQLDMELQWNEFKTLIQEEINDFKVEMRQEFNDFRTEIYDNFENFQLEIYNQFQDFIDYVNSSEFNDASMLAIINDTESLSRGRLDELYGGVPDDLEDRIISLEQWRTQIQTLLMDYPSVRSYSMRAYQISGDIYVPSGEHVDDIRAKDNLMVMLVRPPIPTDYPIDGTPGAEQPNGSRQVLRRSLHAVDVSDGLTLTLRNMSANTEYELTAP